MKKYLHVAGAVTILFAAGEAHAQTVDYKALTDLFGEPVTTSATGKPQRESETPVSMVIISGDEIRRSGARTIPDILQNYAGIDVNQYATGQQEVTIRGGNLPYSPRLLVLVNGRQVFLDHYGYTDWSLIGVTLNEIQQIEVVRGPNSALFGFNAVAGVVNIITVDPLTTQKTSVMADIGNHGTHDGSAMAAFKVNEWLAGKLTAGFHNTNEWASLGSNLPHARNDSASGELTAQLTDKIRATAGYTYSQDRETNQGFAYFVFQQQNVLKGTNASVAMDSKLGLIKAEMFYNFLDQDVLTGNLANFSIRNHVLSTKLNDLFKIGSKNTFRLGVEYRRNVYKVENTDVGSTFYNVYSADAMWEWLPVDRVTLTNAVRMDRLELGHGPINEAYFPHTLADYNQNHTSFSFNSSVAYQANSDTRFRVSAARGIQAPSLNALGVYVALGNPPIFVVAGNPMLSPSTTTTFEAAVDRQIAPINGSFTLTGSTTKVKNFLAASENSVTLFDPNLMLAYLTDAPLGDFRSNAIEATLKGKATDALGWELNYTWTHVKENFLTQTLNDTITMADGTPTHKVNAKLDYHVGPIRAYVVGRYRSSTVQRTGDPVVPGLPLPLVNVGGHVTVDARLGYLLNTDVEIWVAGQNLTNTRGAGLSAYQADTRVRFGLGLKY